MLRNAKARFELAGYQVQTIRITTQPFPEYTRGNVQSRTVLAFFHDLDAVAKQENIMIGIGPALMTDKDDPAQAQLLAEILERDHADSRQRRGRRSGRRPLEGRARRRRGHEISGRSHRPQPRQFLFRGASPTFRAYTPFYPGVLPSGHWDINSPSRWNRPTWWPP